MTREEKLYEIIMNLINVYKYPDGCLELEADDQHGFASQLAHAIDEELDDKIY